MKQTMLFLVLNGLIILFGLVMVVLIPDHDIPKWTVAILCVWNFILGRISDHSLRDAGV